MTSVGDKCHIMCDSSLGFFLVKMYPEQAGKKAPRCRGDLVGLQSRSLDQLNSLPYRITNLVF